MLAAWLLGVTLAAAETDEDARTRVLVSELQARNEGAKKVAALVESFLVERLSRRQSLETLRVEDAPDFKDYGARTYMEACPTGEYVGCTLVVGDRADAAWAITGSVLVTVGSTRVDIDILDIAGSRVAVSFSSEIQGGQDEEFAAGVARVLVAAIKGEIGREEDIRDRPGEHHEDDGADVDKDAVSRELDALQRELGEFAISLRRSNQRIPRPEFTEEDLEKAAQTDATKPWERLGMTPAEYLRYRNSELPLSAWRVRQAGRRFQLLARAGGGWINGPVKTRYYGRRVREETTLQDLDIYGEQAVESGSTATGLVNVGFGIHPAVEVEGFLGMSGGSFSSKIWADEVQGQESSIAPEWSEAGTECTYGGLGAAVTFFPGLKYHPAAGLGLVVMRGTTAKTAIDQAEAVVPTPLFDAATLVQAQVFVGGAVELGKNVGLFARIPVTVLLSGGEVQRRRDTPGGEPVLEGLEQSAGPSAVGGGVVAGVEIRLFGAREQDGPREFEEIEEP
jgi:hypothetical protein